MKQGEPNVPTWQEYLSKNLPAKSKIGMDASLISADDAKDITAELTKIGSSLVPIRENLVDQVWSDRPARPASPSLCSRMRLLVAQAQTRSAN